MALMLLAKKLVPSILTPTACHVSLCELLMLDVLNWSEFCECHLCTEACVMRVTFYC